MTMNHRCANNSVPSDVRDRTIMFVHEVPIDMMSMASPGCMYTECHEERSSKSRVGTGMSE